MAIQPQLPVGTILLEKTACSSMVMEKKDIMPLRAVPEMVLEEEEDDGDMTETPPSFLSQLST